MTMPHPSLTVIITIDTETPQPQLLSGRCTANRMRGEEPDRLFGTPLIMDLLEARGLRGSFFVNVYEYKRFGEETIASICAEITDRGHDVELHTHPVWYGDPSRESMWEYSLDEQTEIVRHGMERIEAWTGVPPVAHRAGAYSADRNTLRALTRNGIPVDASAFFGHPNCRIPGVRNRITPVESIIEVPVTGFFRCHGFRLGPLWIPRSRTFIKTDVDWASPTELERFIEEARVKDLRVMTLFLHSYTLMELDDDCAVSGRDDAKVSTFRDLLARMATEPGIEVMTIRQVHELHEKEPRRLIGSDHVPAVRSPVSALRRLREKVIGIA